MPSKLKLLLGAGTLEAEEAGAKELVEAYTGRIAHGQEIMDLFKKYFAEFTGGKVDDEEDLVEDTVVTKTVFEQLGEAAALFGIDPEIGMMEFAEIALSASAYETLPTTLADFENWPKDIGKAHMARPAWRIAHPHTNNLIDRGQTYKNWIGSLAAYGVDGEPGDRSENEQMHKLGYSYIDGYSNDRLAVYQNSSHKLMVNIRGSDFGSKTRKGEDYWADGHIIIGKQMTTDTFKNTVAQVALIVEEWQDDHPYAEVYLNGHSLGASLVLACMEDSQIASRITLATAFEPGITPGYKYNLPDNVNVIVNAYDPVPLSIDPLEAGGMWYFVDEMEGKAIYHDEEGWHASLDPFLSLHKPAIWSNEDYWKEKDFDGLTWGYVGHHWASVLLELAMAPLLSVPLGEKSEEEMPLVSDEILPENKRAEEPANDTFWKDIWEFMGGTMKMDDMPLVTDDPADEPADGAEIGAEKSEEDGFNWNSVWNNVVGRIISDPENSEYRPIPKGEPQSSGYGKFLEHFSDPELTTLERSITDRIILRAPHSGAWYLEWDKIISRVNRNGEWWVELPSLHEQYDKYGGRIVDDVGSPIDPDKYPPPDGWDDHHELSPEPQEEEIFEEPTYLEYWERSHDAMEEAGE